MKKIFIIISMLISTTVYINAKEQSCKDLPGFKKLGKDSSEYFDCLKKNRPKLNTDSKLTDIITGKEKLKISNPITGIKKLGNALKPDMEMIKGNK
jgi:hypothetical protein